MSAETPESAPFLRVVTPNVTPEEVATLVTVFAALAANSGRPKRRRLEWSAPHRAVQLRYSVGPGGWRSSAMPH